MFVVSAVLAAQLIWGVMHGPALYAAVEQRLAEDMDAEAGAACRRLDFPPGTLGHPQCLIELRRLLAWHGERLQQRSQLLP